jgi:hypothetical protein
VPRQAVENVPAGQVGIIGAFGRVLIFHIHYEV